MARIITEKATAWQLQPYKKNESPEGTRLIAYVATTEVDGVPMQQVKNLPVPNECWGAFTRNPIIHYLEIRLKGKLRRLPLALAGQILPDRWLPKGLTWYGRARVILYWYWQKLLGNV